MGQPQSLPQNKHASEELIYYHGSKEEDNVEEYDKAIVDSKNDPPPSNGHETVAAVSPCYSNDDDFHDTRGFSSPLPLQVESKDSNDLEDLADIPIKAETTATTTTTTLPAFGTPADGFPSQQTPPPLLNSLQDHYSLGTASTTLRFRSRYMRILDDDRNHQLVLEERRINPTGSSTNQTNHSSSATIKLTGTTNFGMAMARTLFTLPALFIMTCTFCFAVQTILFLYMNIVAIETPYTWNENPPALAIVSATLAVPLLLYGLGTGMAMSWALVVDCWRGLSSEQSLLRNMVFWDPMVTQWIALAVFAGIPLLTLVIMTLMRNDDWFEFTIGSWAIAVLLFQTFYMLLAFLNEMNMCLQLLKKHMVNLCQQDQTNLPLWMKLVWVNVLLTQRQKYSGVRHERYLVQGDAMPPPEGFYSDPRLFPVQWNLKLGSRFTLDGFLYGWCGKLNRTFFNVLDPPVRNYNMDEVFGNVMILSKSNWTLERVWCMDRKRSAAITLTEGRSSVSRTQMTSGHLCIALSVVVIILVLAGLLTWMGQSPIAIFVVVLIVFGSCLLPILISSYQVYRFNRKVDQAVGQRQHKDDSPVIRDEDAALQQQEQEPLVESSQGPKAETTSNVIETEDMKISTNKVETSKLESNSIHPPLRQKQPEDGENRSERLTDKAFISVWESVRISEIKPWLCWTTAIVEVSIFFLWPFIGLFAKGNTPVAVVFMVVGIPSVVRHYFNVTNLLQTLGPIDHLDLTSSALSPALCGLGGKGCGKEWWSSSTSSQESFEENLKLKNEALVAAIVRRVTRSRATGNWIALFFFLFFCVFAGFLMASTEEAFDYKVKGVVFASDFYYDAQPQLPYPTCSVQKGFSFPGQNLSALADYSFLSTMAFAGPQESQPLLDQWFGPNQVLDDYQFVTNYREATGTVNHPVSYKLFTISALPTSAVVSIRGSESMWDWMVDIQLWTGGVLAQLVKAINPFGWLWTPILDEMVYVINSVQSDELKQVSYYQFTSRFVEDMYAGFDGRQYENLRVTGASLGGGLAILTGAITGASAIAMSGLNAMYSRRTFEPPISKEELDTRVFNVIPDRDLIARIDRPGMLTQHTQCRGPKNSLFACHAMWRTLCEIQYQCGSHGRPINCWCPTKFGYPIPTASGNATWEAVCADAT